MEFAIQKLSVIALFVVGLSHIFQPKLWVRSFEYLTSLGKVGSFVNAFVHLPLGAAIVAFHNVWTGIPVILTILGYGWVIKSLIYFVFPKVGLRSMTRVTNEKAWQFVVAGILMCAVATLLFFSLLTAV